MRSERFDYLDSVRGLAAFCVLLFHLNDSKGEAAMTAANTRLFSIIFNGHHATSVFFVLSGLVLSYKYLKMPVLNLNYKHFIMRRFYRLYPAYWVSLLVLYVSHHQEHVFAKIEAVLNFLEEAFLYRNRAEIFGGGWTLNIEMAVSLLIPILVLTMRHSRQWFFFLTLISWILTAYYTVFLLHFCLGVWLAADFAAIQSGKYQTHFLYRYRYFLLPVWLCLFSAYYVFEGLEKTEFLRIFVDFTGFHWHQVSGFMAFLLLIWVIGSPRWQRFLRWQPFLWLGKVSYSLYLVQWVVLFVWVNPHFEVFKNLCGGSWLGARLSMAVVGIGLSLVLSGLLYRFVELPCMNYARRRFGSD
jgi:peptidoglycan/LPS O-acetylase OafA/YrhL